MCEYNDHCRPRGSIYLEDHDFSHSDVLLFVIGEEEQVAPVERRFHGPGQNDHDWRFGAGGHHQALPDHQGRTYDHSE